MVQSFLAKSPIEVQKSLWRAYFTPLDFLSASSPKLYGCHFQSGQDQKIIRHNLAPEILLETSPSSPGAKPQT
ncbi:MAG: hypothetical protein NTY64_22000, partial [Deltaproteobacteria bacterium]|nr:hypothetical protein [Deltaproteobacteria bacterium]